MYYDLLPRIKNAEAAGKSSVLAPFSKMDFAIAQVLSATGHIKDVQKKTVGKKNFLEIKLPNQNEIRGIKLVSKPGRHIYVDYRNIKAVKNGYGWGVYSTPKGILSNKDARKQKIGGEYLFEIW
ncbi:MAG: 30S ribosomal protein S8 [Patescibacteria group bacterium]